MKNKISVFIKILIVIILILVLSFNLLMRYAAKSFFPNGAEVLHSYAETNMFEILNSTITEIIEKYSVDYNKLINVSYDNDGNITALHINQMLINIIKSDISLAISNKLNQQDEIPVYVPIGSFCNNMYLMGKGPRIKFILVQRGCVQTDFENEFISAGVNQTMYTLKVNLKADVALMLPFYEAHTQMDTSTILAQTIINGSCPQKYLEIIGGN